MEIKATSQLSALSHPQRLAIFRLLVRRFPDEVPAGQIAAALSFKANTGSVYLSTLMEAGLISQRRKGTSLLYQANLESARELLQYLFSDCCRDRIDTGPVAYRFDPVKLPSSAPMKYNVLFACSGNTARSICAEAILREVGADGFNVYSAGMDPAEGPHPLVLEMLAAKGHQIARLHSKNISLFQRDQAPQIDIMITLCDEAANEESPVWSTRPISTHWGMPDPAKTTGTLTERRQAFERMYAGLKTKIDLLVRMGVHTMHREEVQKALDRIGAQSGGVLANGDLEK